MYKYNTAEHETIGNAAEADALAADPILRRLGEELARAQDKVRDLQRAANERGLLVQRRVRAGVR